MTKFKFTFEKREIREGEQGSVAGTYNLLYDEVKIYLPNIANGSTLIYTPDFMTIFKESYIDECEDKCIELIEKSLKHEYEHKALCTTECPLGKQHDAIEAMEMTEFE